MKGKSLFLLGTVIALSAIMVLSAAVIYTLNFNMNATVAESGSITVTIDGTAYADGESLAIDWGSVTPGQQHNKTITITSTRNQPVTPSIAATGLPTGWTLALNDTSPIPAFGSSARNIVLTVPSDAEAGTSSWSAALTVSSP